MQEPSIYDTYTLDQLKKAYNETIPFFRRDLKKDMKREELIRILKNIPATEEPYAKEEEYIIAEEVPQEPIEENLILEVSESIPKTETNLPSTILKEEDSMESKKTSRKTKSSPIHRIENSMDYVPSSSITYQDFQREIRNPIFVRSFTESIKNMMLYKLEFYEKKKEETENERERVQAKVKKLKSEGIEDSDISKMFPMKSQYAGLIILLKEIIDKIRENYEYIENNPSIVSESLIDAIENDKKGLLSISGRENVKNAIASQLYAFGRNYRTFTNAFNNICLLGGAGTGKTRLAKVISYVYNRCGLLAFDFAKVVSRVDLVAGSVGHTAPKTHAVLMETLESILFIDEAYQLGVKEANKSNDFGPEAITEIVNFLDKYIGMNIVIVAGYPREMLNQFFPTNEGLDRRFPIRVLLNDYSVDELGSILIGFIQEKMEEKLDKDTENYLRSTLSLLHSENRDLFKFQAGDMQNLATSIVKAIDSSYKRKWKKGDIENNIPILKDGFNIFLNSKEYIME